MKRVHRNQTMLNTKYIFLGTPNRPQGPEFSNDREGPLPSLVEKGRQHFPILSDENKAIIRDTCSHQNPLALLKSLQAQQKTLTIEAVRVIERLVAQVITPDQFAPISITDQDQISETLQQDPELIIRDTLDRIQNATNMHPHFVGVSVAYELSTKL